MLGACRYFAPGVDDLLKKFGTYLPLPDRPTDPDVMAWFDLVADLQLAELQAAAPPVDDSEEKGGPYPAVRITDAVDYDDESVPQERRDYYRAIVRYTDFLGEFLDTSVKALMHDFARTAVTYGSAESLAVPPQDAALFIEVMTLGVLGSADESEPSPYDDIVQGLQRGHEELLETMRVIVGQAMIRGFEAEGRRRRTN
jgi:hypothetical protein